MVVKRRSRFAGALQRRIECVWLSEAPGDDSHAARLRVVVNRRPLRSMPMPEWPFRRGGSFNYFTDDVPVGINELGEPVGDRKAYRSTVYGGLMGSGKTVSMLNSVLAQAVDPRVELHIYDLKGGSDWLPLSQIAHFFRSGTDPDDEQAILDDLRELNRRMAARFKTLQTLPEEHRSPRTTDALASTRGLDLHPIVIGIDETSEMFQYSDHRDEYEALVARIIKRGRGVAITVEAGTQEVVKPALPIAGLCHYRHCHAVNGHGAVDLVLGTGAYAAGFDAAALTAADVGIGYFGSGKSISLARSYFLDPDGPEGDEVKDVCDRLRAEREAAGLLTGMASGELGPDDRTDGAPEHVLAVWPGTARAVAYEDLIAPLATTWPGLYGAWVDLEPEEASRALSTALGPDIASVTVAAGKGSRRPRGVTLAAIQAAVEARQPSSNEGDTSEHPGGDKDDDIDRDERSGRFRIVTDNHGDTEGDANGWQSEAGA
jgi:S-DNA-T family DNA segregation ATPase FtsK/SpoIIIE